MATSDYAGCPSGIRCIRSDACCTDASAGLVGITGEPDAARTDAAASECVDDTGGLADLAQHRPHDRPAGTTTDIRADDAYEKDCSICTSIITSDPDDISNTIILISSFALEHSDVIAGSGTD